jgi:hypothetical protein
MSRKTPLPPTTVVNNHTLLMSQHCLVQVMKDSQLFLVVGILLTIDIIIMTTWQVFDPFFRDTYDLRPYVSLYAKVLIIQSF